MTAGVSAITALRLTSTDSERLARFYRELGFTVEGHEVIGAEEMVLLGLRGAGRRVTLRLGGQRLDLDTFEEAGEPYPWGTTAADLSFQHFALVTRDAASAWRHVASSGAVPISSRGPVALPPTTGVAAAIKFRDPEGHPVELLQFPSKDQLPAAGNDGGGLALGIDHSAISVADVDASRRFYEALGLSVHAPTVNRGPTQCALDGLRDVEVDVVPMRPPQTTPHLELLGYRQPRGRPAGRLLANDVAATRIVWSADQDALLRDPDGHLHLLRREEQA